MSRLQAVHTLGVTLDIGAHQFRRQDMAVILVPMDGAQLAERAIPLAANLAKATGADLRLVQAIGLPVETPLTGAWTGLDQVDAGAEEYLRRQAAAIGTDFHLRVTTAVGFGPSASVIVSEAGAAGASHVVMTTHGRVGLGRAVLGSVAEQVVRDSPVPVLLLPAAAGRGQEEHVIRHILLPVDGSTFSHAVVGPVGLLAKAVKADVTLLRVYEHGLATNDPDLRSDVGELRRLMFEVRDVTVAAPDPASQILHMATVLEVDAIAMATHGRSGLDRLAHGSVTEQVLRHSSLPVLTFGKVALRALIPATQHAGELRLHSYGAGNFALT
jgi:nucleotide-binding universal stress UspA family protein